jgi:hypothetical protein
MHGAQRQNTALPPPKPMPLTLIEPSRVWPLPMVSLHAGGSSRRGACVSGGEARRRARGQEAAATRGHQRATTARPMAALRAPRCAAARSWRSRARARPLGRWRRVRAHDAPPLQTLRPLRAASMTYAAFSMLHAAVGSGKGRGARERVRLAPPRGRSRDSKPAFSQAAESRHAAHAGSAAACKAREAPAKLLQRSSRARDQASSLDAPLLTLWPQ